MTPTEDASIRSTELIRAAIAEGANAGVFHRAARLNPRSRAVWNAFAEERHARATALLNEALAKFEGGE